MQKIKAAIIGSGNIGTDLLIKIMRSPYLECTLFIGQNPNSKNLAKAKELGIPISSESINAIAKNPSVCEIVFDATTAATHIKHAAILKELKKFTIDLTPSRVGKMCIPLLNVKEILKENNVNLVTCGGQATVPIAYCIKKIHPETEYIEIVSSLSSKSAGMGTRINIDEYVQTTSDAIKYFTGVKKAKAILILNPAEPPIHTHNTIFAEVNNPDIDLLTDKIKEVVIEIQKYVPGYKLILGPICEEGRITIINQIDGLGDFLPPYAGNLDIITCAAVNVAEEYAKYKFKKKRNK